MQRGARGNCPPPLIRPWMRWLTLSLEAKISVSRQLIYQKKAGLLVEKWHRFSLTLCCKVIFKAGCFTTQKRQKLVTEIAPQILFVAGTITAKQLTEAGLLLVTSFTTVSQIADNRQTSCCIMKFCCTRVNKCDVTRLRHKY